MDDIPQDVLHSTYESAQRDSPPDFLRSVANDFTDRADRERALKRKAWQSRSKELDTVAGHLIGYAEQLAAFIANNPDGVTLVDDPCGALHPHLKSECVHESGHEGDHGNLTDGDWASSDGTPIGKPLKPGAKRKDKEAPQLPGNTGRCASFRRATPDDPTVCTLERGHEGDHADTVKALDSWPRTPSGHVCGDVVILPDGTALNCARPLGHDGDEHHDGRYRLWPRGVGTSRQTNICERCNTDTHTCPGCGDPIGHYVGACDDCNNDPAGSAVVLAETAPSTGFDGTDVTLPAMHPPMPEPVTMNAPTPMPGTVPPCGDREPTFQVDATSCMLPQGHTGKHIGHTGARWEQTAAPTATLGDIAEQQRATMVIPEQRPASDPVPVFTIRESDGAAVYNGAANAPEMAHVAEMKEEVSATVAELTGDEPIGTTVNVGGIEFVKHSNNPFGVRELEITSNPLPQLAFTPENGYSVTPVLGNPFAAPQDAAPTVTLGNPFQAPAPPPAAFLPPHAVPGTAKAHQSHSSITTMEKCGLQYRLKYRDGLGDDTPAWWNVAGTAFHTIVQTIEANYATALATPDAETVWATTAPPMAQEREAAAMWKVAFGVRVEETERESGKARSTWKAAKGGKEGESFWREYGGDLARMYVGHRRAFLAEPEGWRLLSKPNGEGWAHEVEFNVEVDGVLLKGFIDSAWISADGGTILIEDFKSGSSEGDPFQPKLYGAALRALGFIGDRRVITRFYEARKGAHSATVDLTPADDAEVSYRANTAQQMDRLGIFPPSPSGYNCSTCPVKSRCPIMASKS